MGSLQMMNVRVKMRCRASTDPWWGAGQAIPSILHGFGVGGSCGCLGRSFWTHIWTG